MTRIAGLPAERKTPSAIYAEDGKYIPRYHLYSPRAYTEPHRATIIAPPDNGGNPAHPIRGYPLSGRGSRDVSPRTALPRSSNPRLSVRVSVPAFFPVNAFDGFDYIRLDAFCQHRKTESTIRVQFVERSIMGGREYVPRQAENAFFQSQRNNRPAGYRTPAPDGRESEWARDFCR